MKRPSRKRKNRPARREPPAERPATDSPTRAEPSRSTPLHRRRRWLILGACSLAAALVIAVGASFMFQPTPPQPPPASLEGLSAPVQDILRVAQQDVRRQPFSADSWGRLGMVLSAHQMEQDARRCFEQAAKLAPRDFRWPYLRAISLSVEQPEAAREQFRQALALNADSAPLYCRLAELEMSRRDWAEAERLLSEATRLKPDYARAWLDRATVALRRGELERSRADAERALRFAAGQRAPHALLARVLSALGERDEALRHLEAAQALPDQPLLWEDPLAAAIPGYAQDSEALLRQAEQLAEQNRPREAAALLEQVIASHPPDPRAHLLLAGLLRDNGRLDESSQVLRAAAHGFPESAAVCFQSGVVCFLRERWEDAAKQFREAIRRKPDHALAHYNLGHSLRQLGDDRAAREAFAEAVRFQPDHADARINLARLLNSEGDSRAAREQLRIAAQLQPDAPEPRRLLRQWASEAEEHEPRPESNTPEPGDGSRGGGH